MAEIGRKNRRLSQENRERPEALTRRHTYYRVGERREGFALRFIIYCNKDEQNLWITCKKRKFSFIIQEITEALRLCITCAHPVTTNSSLQEETEMADAPKKTGRGDKYRQRGPTRPLEVRAEEAKLRMELYQTRLGIRDKQREAKNLRDKIFRKQGK